MANDEIDKKGVGLSEVALGATAGAATFGAASGMYAKWQLSDEAVKKAGALLVQQQKEAQALATPTLKAAEEGILNTLNQAAPGAAHDAAKVADMAKEQLAKNMQAWEKVGGEAAQKTAAAAVETAEKSVARVSAGNAALQGKSFIKKPFIAFSNASMPAKVAIGATVALAALGTGMAINSLRNRESSVERYKRERNNEIMRG